MGGSNGELQDLTDRLVDRPSAYGMEVSREKSKIMTNSTNNISADINMDCQKLEEVTSFTYLGATLCKDGTCSAEVRIRIASAMAAMARLNRIWRCNTISFASKVKLHKSLVTSTLVYACETWTLLADSGKRIQALETECLWKLLHTSYLEHNTNDRVRNKISVLVGPREPFPETLRDGNSHGSGMSHATTASPKAPFKASWKAGDTVVIRGNAG